MKNGTFFFLLLMTTLVHAGRTVKKEKGRETGHPLRLLTPRGNGDPLETLGHSEHTPETHGRAEHAAFWGTWHVRLVPSAQNVLPLMVSLPPGLCWDVPASGAGPDPPLHLHPQPLPLLPGSAQCLVGSSQVGRPGRDPGSLTRRPVPLLRALLGLSRRRPPVSAVPAAAVQGTARPARPPPVPGGNEAGPWLEGPGFPPEPPRTRKQSWSVFVRPNGT